MAAMDSCFALVGAHQHGIAVGSMDQDYPVYQRPFTAEASASTPLRELGEFGKFFGGCLDLIRDFLVSAYPCRLVLRIKYNQTCFAAVGFFGIDFWSGDFSGFGWKPWGFFGV